MTLDLDISVVIITLNEEQNIERCLQSIPPGAEAIVLDSGSTDQTVALAKARGAKVFHKPFTNYSDQKNAAVQHATRSWIFSLDADEVMDAELGTAIAEQFRPPVKLDVDARFAVKRRLVFMGQVMRYGKTVDSPIRLFRKGGGEFAGAIHEQVKFPTFRRVEHLPGSLYHYSYKDLSDYFLRFNRYTTSIATSHRERGKRKNFWLHVLRPWYEFTNRYIVHLGFLDGYAGYTYALISSLYSYIKYAKLFELKADGKNG